MPTSKKKKSKSILDVTNVRDFLSIASGKMAPELVQVFIGNKNALGDEEVAEKLNLKVTQVRTMLNSLYYRGITNYSKTRNKNSGWYTYKWTMNEKRIAELILEKNIEELEKLKEKITYEQNYMYFECLAKCGKLQFEIAAEYEFKCPSCGETMNSINNEEELKGFNNKITVLAEDIEHLKDIIDKSE